MAGKKKSAYLNGELPSNLHLQLDALRGINPFSRRWDARYAAAAWYYKRGYTPNQLGWWRVKWSWLPGLLLMATLLAPPGAVQYTLALATIVVGARVWLWDLWDGPLAIIGQLDELTARGRHFLIKALHGEVEFNTKPYMSLAEEQALGWRIRLRLRGVTHMGETLDPAGDKLLFSSVHLALVATYTQCWPIVLSAIFAEGLLLLARPIKNWLGLNAKAATWVGKVKVHIQWTHQLGLLVMAIATKNEWWGPVDRGTLLLIGAFALVHTLLWSLLSIGSHVWSGWKAWPTRIKKVTTRTRPVLYLVRNDDDSDKT